MCIEKLNVLNFIVDILDILPVSVNLIAHSYEFEFDFGYNNAYRKLMALKMADLELFWIYLITAKLRQAIIDVSVVC